MGHRRRGRAFAGVAAVVLTASLAACSNDDGGPPSLTWYINPDDGGQAEIAKICTEEAAGAYTIETSLLPRDAPGQREQLVRRLAAQDTSIDLMSLDPPFVPEFAEAGFLADIPEEVETEVTDDVLEGALAGATWKDELVAIPFWANTQILWYRTSVAEAAGLDVDAGPVTWDQIIEAAESEEVTIAAQGIRAESLTVWINALIEGAGGQIIENPGGAGRPGQAGADLRCRTRGRQGDRGRGELQLRTSGFHDGQRGLVDAVVPGRGRRLPGQLPVRLARLQGSGRGGRVRPGGARRLGLGALPGDRRGRGPGPAAGRHRHRRQRRQRERRPVVRGRSVHRQRGEPEAVLHHQRQPGGQGCRVRRPRGAGGLPDGRRPARVARAGRTEASDRLLQRGLHRAPEDLAPAVVPSTRRARRRTRPT